jgi:hypothetical protein
MRQALEDIGISHKTAKKVLRVNSYNYDKAITQLIAHILLTLDPQYRLFTSLAVAKAIGPNSLDYDMDAALDAMVQSQKRP